MALKACSECSGQVSDKAEACPHCGAPQKAASETSDLTSLKVREKGLLTQEEFGAEEAELLGESEPPPKQAGPNPTNMFATRLAVLLGGGLLTLVVLFFLYALLFVDAPSDAPGLTWPDSGERHATLGIALQDLKSITEMCGGEPTRDTVNGRPRFMCTRMTHPAFALEAIGEERYLSKATIMQGVGGNSVQIMQQMMNGLELFQIVAGAKVGEFMPDGWFASMAQEDTMVAYDGRIYTTKLLPEMGMIMLSVSPAD